MKKYYLISFFLLFVGVQFALGQAKYVFYFIGDGMGVNQLNATEKYLSALTGNGRGSAHLLMTTFPVATFCTTYSDNNDVTDSAASGTALATGTKTYNSAIGLGPNKERLTSIAERAKKAGKKVGVASTVPVNHATPAAFYGHQENRSMYYEISQDLLKSNFDFFGGAGFYNRDNYYDKSKAPDIFPQIEQAGYTVFKGYDAYKANAKKTDKVVLIQKNWEEAGAIPYAIDRKEDDLTLAQITEAAIEVLMRNNKKGFFVMLEGGRIDWADHANDAATMVEEIIDFDNAIQVAYEFYKKHPKETLIVITADHDTGGLSVMKGSLEKLKNQKQSQDELTKKINALRESKNGKVSWEEVKDLLSESMGFWKDVPITWEQEKKLRDTYEATLAKNVEIKDKNLYAENSLLAAKAKEVMSEAVGLRWATGSHSAGYVPVIAIGAGQEQFTHKMDNIDIPKTIAKIAKY